MFYTSGSRSTERAKLFEKVFDPLLAALAIELMLIGLADALGNTTG